MICLLLGFTEFNLLLEVSRIISHLNLRQPGDAMVLEVCPCYLHGCSAVTGSTCECTKQAIRCSEFLRWVQFATDNGRDPRGWPECVALAGSRIIAVLVAVYAMSRCFAQRVMQAMFGWQSLQYVIGDGGRDVLAPPAVLAREESREQGEWRPWP
jgi:hypothetical protein